MADNQNTATVDWIGKDVETKKGKNGVGVSDPEKNATIELAHGVWTDMGLSNEQIAAGIATMNIESGFNSKAEHTQDGETYIGLGQFDDDTWDEAVTKYNKYFNEKLDPAKERYDILSQIKVSGAWIKDRIWPNAVYYNADPSLEGNSLQEIAYGLWHEGASKKEGKVDKLKTFLEGTKNDQFLNKTGGLSTSFNDTYDTIDAELHLRDEASKDLDNAVLQAQKNETNKSIWDVVIEELKKFLDESDTQDIIQQFINQQSSEKYPVDRRMLWEIEKAETGENENESLER